MTKEKGSFLKKLKSLISVEFNSPLVAININKNSNNNVKVAEGLYYDKDKKILDIDLNRLPEEKKKVAKEVIKDYIEEGNKLLELKTNNCLESLYKYNKKNPNKAILDFFKPIIPSNDYEALESALFLREKFHKREDVNKLKQDIRTRFGDRGNNISNLCTAGYFEELLMPLYNSSKEEFKRVYEDIVKSSMLALFVHSQMEDKEIPNKITEKLNISKKYGIKWIHIHGIGKSNVKKIKRCIEEKKKFFDFFEKRIYDSEYIIVVQLLFK